MSSTPAATLVGALVAAGLIASGLTGCSAPRALQPTTGGSDAVAAPDRRAATQQLDRLVVKGRAPKTGYARSRFGPAWYDADRNGCDTRNDVLHRDLQQTTLRAGTAGCVVLTGSLTDPYTGRRISFSKSRASAVQIDHVVALSDAWQTGAQQWTDARRLAFANDPRNLQATDGPTNEQKGDADAASWLPPNQAYRCIYVERPIGVKVAYGLWATPAERDAFRRVLGSCPG
jgi:uncharacterized protein DUF1524